MPAMPVVQLALLSLLLGGCVHRFEVSTSPPGGMATFNGTAVTGAPYEVAVHPFGRRQISVVVPGYRPMSVKLARTGPLSYLTDALTFHWLRALGLVTYAKVELALVPEHGPIGTWNAEDID